MPQEGKGLRPFFRGVGPRALSNGLNSAIFFCFFEAIRQVRSIGYRVQMFFTSFTGAPRLSHLLLAWRVRQVDACAWHQVLCGVTRSKGSQAPGRHQCSISLAFPPLSPYPCPHPTFHQPIQLPLPLSYSGAD